MKVVPPLPDKAPPRLTDATVQSSWLLPVTVPNPGSNRVCLLPSTNYEDTHMPSLGKNVSFLESYTYVQLIAKKKQELRFTFINYILKTIRYV